jgi:hypothetical protein
MKMKNIFKILFLTPIILGGVNSSMAQIYKNGQNYFIGAGKNKMLVLDGVKHSLITPSIFSNGVDTLEKLQSPRPLTNPVVRDEYKFVVRLKEPLSFKKAECTSWQWVDIYKKNRFTPKKAPEAIVIVKDSLIYEQRIDSFYVDTGSIVYVGPRDTSLLILEGYAGISKRSPLSFMLGFSTEFGNGKTDPRDTSILLNNLRYQMGIEGGIFKSQKRYGVVCDTCYVWGPEEEAFQAWTDFFIRAKYGPKKRSQKNLLTVFAFIEGRFRILGPVSSIPTDKKINRLSFNFGGELIYGPVTLQLGVTKALGLEIHPVAGLLWRFVYKEPTQTPVDWFGGVFDKKHRIKPSPRIH